MKWNERQFGIAIGMIFEVHPISLGGLSTVVTNRNIEDYVIAKQICS